MSLTATFGETEDTTDDQSDDATNRGGDREDAPDQPQPLPAAEAEDKIGMIPLEPASLVMERKMLLGIRARAERLATERKEAARD
jgi:hypothetical protein